MARDLADAVELAAIKHLLKIEAWTQPADLYLGVHINTNLAASASTAATSISVDHVITQGAEITINPGGVNEETFCVGTVSGSGPYTVNLVDAAGASDALGYDHADNEPVVFEPGDDLANVRAPSGGSYARVEAEAWANPATNSSGYRQCSNSGTVAFAQASADWGLSRWLILYDASSSGNALAKLRLDAVVEIDNGYTLSFAAGTLKISSTAPHALADRLLKHLLLIASWTQATNLYVAMHKVTTLSASASAGAGSISVAAAVAAGAKLVLNAGFDTTEETVYAGTVTGSGPYTVTLVNAAGAAATLTYSHLSGERVAFTPGLDGANYSEPSSGAYARVTHNNWNTPAEVSDLYTSTNDGVIEFAKATAAWGVVSHLLVLDSSSSGNLLLTSELSEVANIVINATPKIADEAMTVRIG
jgi:hypothetical protein